MNNLRSDKHDRKYRSTKNFLHPSVSKRFGQEAFQLDGLSRKKTFCRYVECTGEGEGEGGRGILYEDVDQVKSAM